MDFESREDQDGVRLSWNRLPKSKLQHDRNIIPLGALYTPLNNKSEPIIPILEDPSCLVSCRGCRTILNPYVLISNEIWTCPCCSSSNQLPPLYDTAGVAQLHPSVTPEYSTVEYKTGKHAALPPIFFYVVDTCFEQSEEEDSLAQLKESLIVSLSLLPEDSLVGFISFGKHVRIHDLTNGDNVSYGFNGNKQYTLEQIQTSLGMLSTGLSSNPTAAAHASVETILGVVGKKFLVPVNIGEYQLTRIIESITPNLFPRDEFTQRPERCTGSAINIASLLLRAILGNHVLTTGGHLLVFSSGVCTIGPGKIVDQALKEPMRSHNEIEKSYHSMLPTTSTSSSNTKSNISLFQNAKKFYKEVTKNLVKLGLSCNYFIGSYDQIGLFEMDEVCYKTGGVVVMSDSFTTTIFKQSFLRFFKKDEFDYLDMGFNATLEIKTSPDLKIQGLLGNATSLPYNKTIAHNERMFTTSADSKIGDSGTNSFKLCNVNPQSTYAIFFEKLDSIAPASTVQFLFHYQHPNGEMRLRVTTVALPIVADSDTINLEPGFDQEAALVLIARKSIHKLSPECSNQITTEVLIKQLDQLLVDFCARFAVYTLAQPESFRLSSIYSLLPQFLYHLRRSPFIKVFGNSPDETSFIRHLFMHEDTSNSLVMIQPTLLSYDINEWNEENTEPVPVLLDSLSLGPSKILLLDTFFQILIYHGSQIAAWRNAKYHEQPDYSYFKDFLEAPKQEAMTLLMDRFPLPRFIDCDENGSQARFLMAKLNPSTNYATNVNQFVGGASGSIASPYDVLTDDLNLQSYMEHLQRLVVNKK
ncbi:Protein transport protein SEC23 [Spathaspora sp. JA1]|nr:Protein transport protein SEC23 [Spathaspora sp. JA1]